MSEIIRHLIWRDQYQGKGNELRHEFAIRTQHETPKIVCLCGSTRFREAFDLANRDETLAGNIVLSVGCFSHADHRVSAEDFFGREAKAGLDELHKRKIDLADEILVLNVDGYVGSSTRSEIEYAKATGKPIRWKEPVDA